MTGTALLRMTGIVKEFPGVRALDGVDLDVRRGEVHCLLGQNGAGKSTLIKVLAGAHQPDAGTIVWDGAEVVFPRPVDALRAGLATIYQELDLVDGLTVADNVFLGHERSRGGFIDRRSMDEAAAAVLARLGHPEIPPRREVGALSAAGKQIVSMARALSHDARLIVMDEPSAVLASDEVDNLFRVIRELQREGIAVVYISHRLDEIREIGDRVTVLKDGRTLDRLALAAEPGAGGLSCSRTSDGERTPDLPDATGSLVGLRRGNMSPGNVARAAVEGMLCGLADGLAALRELGVPLRRVLLIGGAARSSAVREAAPSLFGMPVVVPTPAEYVAIGAARQAAWVRSGGDAPPEWPPHGQARLDRVDDAAGRRVREAYAGARAAVHGR